MKIIIIGSGVAGVTAARELVKAHRQIEVHLYNAEAYPYYPRPRLWEYIAGKTSVERLYFQPPEWYARQGILLHQGVAVRHIEVRQHRILLAHSTHETYDRLLLATGASPYTLPLEGSELPGVFNLRTLDDARNIVTHADTVPDAIVIGGGLLGLETAHSLHLRGKKTTVIEVMRRLLPRQLDEAASDMLQAHLETLGIEVLKSADSEAIRVENGSLCVHLKDSRRVCAGQVIFSAGIRPRLELPQAAGLALEKGVQVDDYLMTGAEDVFAAGDVCEHRGVIYGIIPAAMEQARAAAQNILSHRSTPYQGTMPSTRLKIAGMEFNTLGEAVVEHDDALTVLRFEKSESGVYRRLNIKDGKISGAILLGENQNVQPVRQLIASARDVSAYVEEMASAAFDFKSLASAGS